jgi:8-amino-3,8-dideoxy-alpha-D-manno-octulosonate transaminase
MSASSTIPRTLAIHGGAPARQTGFPPMYPGGMAIGQEEEELVLRVLRSKRLFRYYGPEPGPSLVDQLESEFAEHHGARHALAVTSGTAALVCGLQGIGIAPGDEVIIPAYTWIASASAVLAAGGIPVLAEVDESLTLDPADVEAKITPYTRAIMAVHMRGAACRMDELLAIARRHNLKLIEDAAQANGASYHGGRLGTLGDVGCFSLQFNKIITSGEGGMVVTENDEVWKRAVMWHDVIGGLRNNLPSEEILWGTNYRMPELLAAVMLAQLHRLDGLLDAMRARKRMLKAGMAGIAAQYGVTFRDQPDPDGDAAIALVFFMPDTAQAERVAAALRAENIGAGVMYHPDRSDYHVYSHWTPIIEQRTWTPDGGPWRWAHRDVHYTRDMCPQTLDLLARAVHLDVSPLLTNEDVEETLEGINSVLEQVA